MNIFKIALVGIAGLLGIAGGAMAMPAAPLATHQQDAGAQIENARVVCDSYGCFRRREVYRPRYFAPRPRYHARPRYFGPRYYAPRPHYRAQRNFYYARPWRRQYGW